MLRSVARFHNVREWHNSYSILAVSRVQRETSN
jgi:hypothetical protein